MAYEDKGKKKKIKDDTQICGSSFWAVTGSWTRLVQENEQVGNGKIAASVHGKLQMEEGQDIWLVSEELWGDM